MKIEMLRNLVFKPKNQVSFTYFQDDLRDDY